MRQKKLLSLDMSTKSSGWSTFDMMTNELLSYGRIEKYKEEEPDMRKRVAYMMDNIKEVILKHEPTHIVAENVPPSIQNASTVLALGILQGAVYGMAYTLGLEMDFVNVPTWHSALDIKKSKGDLKKQSIDWVNEKYGLELVYKSPSSKYNMDDVSDSVAIGSFYLGNYEKQVKKQFGRK